MGNHDKARTVTWWKDVGFQDVSLYPIIVDEFYIFSHEPVYLNKNMPYANIHGHTHSTCYKNKQYVNVSVEALDYKPIEFDKIKEKLK